MYAIGIGLLIFYWLLLEKVTFGSKENNWNPKTVPGQRYNRSNRYNRKLNRWMVELQSRQ